MSDRRLYVFQCPTCHSTYTSAVKPAGSPYQCFMDRSWLRLLYEQPIETAEDEATAARCPFWNNTGITGTARGRMIWCDACPKMVPVDDGIDLGAGGAYCSKACADLGTERHHEAMAAQRDRVEQLYLDMPWLRPREKETA